MNETRKMNFRIEDAITEAYDQMNEAHCGTGRKDEVKKPPMHYAIYDKKTKEVYATSTKPFDKFKLDDVADDMKVKKSDLVMKKMKKGQNVDSKLKESHCGTDRKDEAKFDKLRKKLKYINPETLQDVLDGKIKLNPAEKKEFDMFMRDARKMFGASKEEVNEQLSAKFSKDFDKEAKQKGPHQDSSVYKQMRDIIKSKGMGTVKTDKGSMKVDMQSAYRWLASYHMLSDKNKKNLVKMAQRGKDSLATTIKVAQTLTVKR